MIADIMLNKYRYHLPFYRQSKLFASHGIRLADNTIAGWVMEAAERLALLEKAWWQEFKKIKRLQVDESPVKILKPDKKGYMWVYHSYLLDKRFVLFDFSSSRAGSIVDARLKAYQGLLQTDGYSGYNGQRARSDVVTLGCWDHARRKFAEVVKVASNNKTGKAGNMLKRIAKLYELEREIAQLPAEERQRIRAEKAAPKLAAIKSMLHKNPCATKQFAWQSGNVLQQPMGRINALYTIR